MMNFQPGTLLFNQNLKTLFNRYLIFHKAYQSGSTTKYNYYCNILSSQTHATPGYLPNSFQNCPFHCQRERKHYRKYHVLCSTFSRKLDKYNDSVLQKPHKYVDGRRMLMDRGDLNKLFNLKDIKSNTSVASWGIRLANENGYLSWCRNTYLASVLAINLYKASNTVPAEMAAMGVFALATANLCWGTTTFIYDIWAIRHHVDMSTRTCIANTSAALIHLGVWIIALTMFLGNVDKVDVVIKEDNVVKESDETLYS